MKPELFRNIGARVSEFFKPQTGIDYRLDIEKREYELVVVKKIKDVYLHIEKNPLAQVVGNGDYYAQQLVELQPILRNFRNELILNESVDIPSHYSDTAKKLVEKVSEEDRIGIRKLGLNQARLELNSTVAKYHLTTENRNLYLERIQLIDTEIAKLSQEEIH